MRYGLRLCMIATGLGCHRDGYYQPASTDGVQFVAQAQASRSSPDTIDVWITMRNTTSDVREIRQGGCPPYAQFVSVPRKKNEKVHKWDWMAMEDARAKKSGAGFGCPALLHVSGLGGGYGRTYKAFSVAAKEVLGDSLPSGPYAVTLITQIQGAPPVPAGVVDLPASNVRLAP